MNVANLIGMFAALAWVLAVVVVIFAVFQASRGRPVRNSAGIVIVVLIAAAVLTTVSSGLVFINPQERGVVISAIDPKGYREQALEPGLRWIVPFAESVVVYPISRQTYTMSIASKEGQLEGDDSITARTADGQEIYVDASVIYAIDPAKVVQVHIVWQTRYGDELVRPQARGIVRDVVSQYGVEQVVSTKRFEMAENLRSGMAKKLSENGLILEDFILRNITFSQEYAASVEQKQIAEQQAQQAKFVVEQRRQEAEQARQSAQGQADAVEIRAKGDAAARLIQAEAEAKALNMINESLKNNPDLLTYQYITKLSPNISAMLLPSNTPFLYTLPNMQNYNIPAPQTPSEGTNP